MRTIPVKMAQELRDEGMAWRDVAQEIAWATGRIFTFDAVAAACYRENKRTRCGDKVSAARPLQSIRSI